VLAEQGYVSLIDVLMGVGYLHPVHVDGWRKGRVACLEEWIFVPPDNIQKPRRSFTNGRAAATCLQWAVVQFGIVAASLPRHMAA